MIKINFFFCLLLLYRLIAFSQCAVTTVSFNYDSIDACTAPQAVNFNSDCVIDTSRVLIGSQTIGFMSKQTITFPMNNNGCVYVLKVSGSFSPWGNNEHYDVFGKFGYSGNLLINQDSKFVDYFNVVPDSQPASYNPNHVYYLYFTGSNSSGVKFTFTDNPYNDNSGSVTFEWYAIPCFDFQWDVGLAAYTDTTFEHIFATSGTYPVLLTVTDKINNCSKQHSDGINIYPQYDKTINKTICSGESYTVGPNTYNQAGTFYDTLQSKYGCDSIINIVLSVQNQLYTIIDTMLCSGSYIDVNTNTYFQSGIYYDTLSAFSGCDSIVELNLTVTDPKITYLDTVICSGGGVVIGGNTYFSTGIYTDTLLSLYNCDSIIELNLTVNTPYTYQVDTTICKGGLFIVGSSFYSVSGTYNDTLASVSGCDSIIITSLTVLDTLFTNLNVSICEGYFYPFGYQNYDSSGVYTTLFKSQNGCDSVVILNLTVYDTVITNTQENICEGDYYQLGSSYYTLSGDYMDTLTAVTGCDSIVKLKLEVRDTSYVTISESICKGDLWYVGSNVYTTSGNYQDVLNNTNGCDSLVVTWLNVNPKPFPDLGNDKALCKENMTLAPGIFYSYMWSNGSTDSVLMVESPGEYWVNVTDDNGCIASDSVLINEGSCSQVYIPAAFTPNHDGINDYFAPVGINIADFKMWIFNSWGTLVYEGDEYMSESNQTVGWNGLNNQAGIYSWLINYIETDEYDYQVSKVIRGAVTLIR